MNPSVSFTLALLGKFSWKKLPVYIVAQFLGSFMAAAVLFGVYWGKNKYTDIYGLLLLSFSVIQVLGNGGIVTYPELLPTVWTLPTVVKRCQQRSLTDGIFILFSMTF